MQSVAKYFLIVLALFAISVSVTVFLNLPHKQAVETAPQQPVGTAVEFPIAEKSHRDQAIVVHSDDLPQASGSSDPINYSGSANSGWIGDLFRKIRSNFALDNWVDTKITFRWVMSVEGLEQEVTIAGAGFSADSNEVQIEGVESLLQAEGFRLDDANMDDQGLVAVKGFQKQQQTCLLIKTLQQAPNKFEPAVQNAMLEMRCGAIE